MFIQDMQALHPVRMWIILYNVGSTNKHDLWTPSPSNVFKNTLLQFRGRIFDLSEGIHSSVSHRVGKTDVRGPHLDLFVCWPPDIVYSLAQDNTKEFVMDGTRVGKRSNSSSAAHAAR